MFGRNTKYQKVVAAARKAAERTNEQIIVYRIGRHYNYCTGFIDYNNILLRSDKPVTQLLICLSNGAVCQ